MTSYISFLRPVCVSKSRSNFICWWAAHEGRIPSLAQKANYFFANQASSVASENKFFAAGTVITDYRRRIADGAIKIFMLLRSCISLLNNTSILDLFLVV